MKFAIETVTPKTATNMLENNPKNRHLSHHIIRQYTDAMKDGEWKENGETLKFTDDGALMDGQHRLHAVIQSKTTQKMLVVRGLKIENMDTIDIGKKRTNADALEMAGYKNKIHLAAAINICLGFTSNDYKGNAQKKTPTAALNYLKRNPRLSTSMNRYVGVNQNKEVTSVMKASMFAALHYKFSQVDKELADEFMQHIIDSEEAKKGNPALTLVDRLRVENRNIYEAHGVKYKRKVIAYAVQAFNAFANGETLVTLKYDQNNPIIIEKL